MTSKILECNVDDISKGGVYSLIRNVIRNNSDKNKIIDIASIAEFEDKADIEELKKYNCSVYFVGSKKSKLLRFYNIYRNTKKLIKSEGYDYIHIHSDTSYTVFPFLLAAKKSNVKKVIIHSHAAGLDGAHRKIKLFLHNIFKNYVSNSDAELVACSDVAGKWMFRPDVKVRIINNGIELQKFKYNPIIRKEIREKLKLEEKIVIGNVGRFAFQKNHSFLIEILEKLRKEIPNVKLLLVGEGPLKSELKNLVKEKKLTNYVNFYGTSEHVNELLQGMDLFVLTSYFEVLPIAGVEAQAAGLPSIFSDRITKSAGLIKNSSFLPIEDSKENINKWVEKIKEYSTAEREISTKELEEKGYSIKQTVLSFLDLYKES